MGDAKQTDEKAIKRGAKGYFLEGTAAGPGRPKGSKSIKDAIRRYLEDNPEDFEDFVTHFVAKNRELAWQMLEGRPSQQTDITSGGKPIPILGGISVNEIPKNDSSPEDTQT